MSNENLRLDTDLLSRTNDQATYTLWHSHETDSRYVTVDDRKSGETYSVPVLDGENAMDVYKRPYFYRQQIGEVALTGPPGPPPKVPELKVDGEDDDDDEDPRIPRNIKRGRN